MTRSIFIPRTTSDTNLGVGCGVATAEPNQKMMMHRQVFVMTMMMIPNRAYSSGIPSQKRIYLFTNHQVSPCSFIMILIFFINFFFVITPRHGRVSVATGHVNAPINHVRCPVYLQRPTRSARLLLLTHNAYPQSEWDYKRGCLASLIPPSIKKGCS